MRDSVTDARARESVDFRKRAQHDNIPAIPNVLEGVGRIVDELVIRFIENRDDIFRNARHVLIDFVLGDQCAGWVVRVGDEDNARLRCNRIQHSVEIVFVIRARSFDCARAKKCCDQFVGNESMLGSDRFVAGF